MTDEISFMPDIYYCCDCLQASLDKEVLEKSPVVRSYHGWNGPPDKHCIHFNGRELGA